MESNEVKQLVRYVYHLAKNIDEQLIRTNKIEDIFSTDVDQKRKKIREKCEQILYLDHEGMGKRAREILWRQGCYNSVSKLKKILRDQPSKSGAVLTPDELDMLKRFLFDVIKEYRQIILNFEYKFNLDLRYLIDFNLIGRKEANGVDQLDPDDISIEITDYGLKTVQFLLIALGDIHRYLNDFHVKLHGGATSPFECALKFYKSAFILNPLNGMAQNQLGTLLVDKCYDIDSIFHYLFSLMCQIPFDLSESNLNKIFQKNIDFIETITDKETVVTTISDNINFKNFVSRFILIVDIYYFDKVVYDFNSLCHFVLVELKRLLSARLSEFDGQFIFKMTSILFFCMSHLKLKNSEKIHNLNALMVALTSELIDSCTRNFERDVLEYAKDDSEFSREYSRLYEEEYERRRPVVKPKNKLITAGEGQPSKSQSSVENAEEVKPGEEIRTNSQNKTKLQPKDRRRRRRVHTSSSSSQSDDEDMVSDFDSDHESEYGTDDESDNDEFSSLSSCSDKEEDDDRGANHGAELELKLDQITLNGGGDHDANSDVDIVVEEEKIMFIDDNDDIIIEEEKICNGVANDLHLEAPQDFNGIVNGRKRSERRRRLPRYTKIDPNLILRFAATEKTLKSLKLLFDWLRNNIEILINCYTTNPEFFHKIMKLLNYLNIDIFTKTVFFDLKLVKSEDLRLNITELFDDRHKLPLSEDIDLKGFIMFEANQSSLDWNLKTQMEITDYEESFVRISKMVDFGFFLTKSHKFNYVFCKKTRNFIDGTTGRVRRTRRGGRRRGGEKRSRNRFRANNNRSRNRNRERNKVLVNENKYSNENGMIRPIEEKGAEDVKNKNAKKIISENDKYEIMGKLWLRNEVETLESKVTKPSNQHFTPYLIMDSKSLTEFTPIVRNFVRTKKFIVLIPNAVFSELDDLKKHSEGARNAIRWLEQEFQKGNRFIRSQRDEESLHIPMIKIPKKLDRESSTFIQIVQFCYYIINANQESTDILTFLTGENLSGKKSSYFSFSGILNSVGIKYELISMFYAKYKKK